MTCLNINPDRDQLSRLGAASVTQPSPHSASVNTASAANARPQPTIGYGVLAAARSQRCSDLAANPNSRILLGRVRELTHLMLMLELEARG